MAIVVGSLERFHWTDEAEARLQRIEERAGDSKPNTNTAVIKS